MTDNLPEVAQPGPASILALIARAAENPAVNVATMEALFKMHRELAAEQALIAFNVAMNRAQAEIQPVARTTENTQTHSFYAKLEAVDEAIRPIYLAHGFSLSYNTVPPLTQGYIRVECRCAHCGGHVELFHREAPADTLGPKGTAVKTVLHGEGSTETFLKRYLACGIFNVVFRNQDDDGNRGGARYLDAESIAEIEALITQTKSDRTRFLQYMGVDSVGEIQMKDKAAAMNALAMKRRHAQAGGPPEAEREGLDVAVQTPPSADDYGRVDERVKSPSASAAPAKRPTPGLAGSNPAPSAHTQDNPPPDGGEAAEARGGSGESRTADAAIQNPERSEINDAVPRSSEDGQSNVEIKDRPSASGGPGAPRTRGGLREHAENAAGAGGSPATDIVGELGRKLTAAAQQGQRALDIAWHKLTEQERDIARPMRPQYREIAEKAGSADAKQK